LIQESGFWQSRRPEFLSGEAGAKKLPYWTLESFFADKKAGMPA
jgi:hypothetical protein